MRRLGAGLGLVLVGALLAAGCIGPEKHDYTPLEEAIVGGSELDEIQLILEAGASPNERSYSGGPLGAAVGRSDPDPVRLLLSFGADASGPSAAGGSYLVTVAVDRQRGSVRDDLAIAQLLIDSGADPCIRSTDERTEGLRPSEVAEFDGRSELAGGLAEMERVCDG